MIEFTRRRALTVTAGAAAALGASRTIAFLPSAVAEEAAAKGFHSFKAGDIAVTTVFDGIWEKPHDPGFIKNATLDETKAALRAAGLADRSAISTIIVTHFHPDHIFGLMEEETNAQIYPNADIVIPAAEMKFWSDAGVFARLPEAFHGLAKRIQATLPTWKNVRLIEGESDVVAGIRSIPAHGHTAGHTVYALGSGSEQLMVLADTTNIPALFVRHPGWHAAFDADAVAAEANRRKLFDRVVADRAIMTGYHYGVPGAGRIEKDGDGYAFVPIA